MSRKIKYGLLTTVLAISMAFIIPFVSHNDAIKVFANSIENAVESAELNKVNLSAEKKIKDEDIYVPRDLHEEEYDKTEIIAEDVSKRTETSKTFVQADGTYVYQNYGTPIHYLEGDEYKEIDNTINEKFQNAANSFTVTFDDGNRESLVRISDNIGAISMEPMFEIQTEKNILVNNNTKKLNSLNSVNSLNVKNKGLKEKINNAFTNIDSSIYYADIKENVDIEYILEGDKLKENIIINAPLDEYEFTFSLNLVGYDAIQIENEIRIFDCMGEIVYYIPQGFMYDTFGEVSYDVDYNLVHEEESYFLTVTADASFFETSAFPIIIDPTIQKWSLNNDFVDKLSYSRSNTINRLLRDSFASDTNYNAILGYNRDKTVCDIVRNYTITFAELQLTYTPTSDRSIVSTLLLTGDGNVKGDDKLQVGAYFSSSTVLEENLPNIPQNAHYARINVTRYFSYFNTSYIALRDFNNRTTTYSTPNLMIAYVDGLSNESSISQDMGIDGVGNVNLLSGKLNYAYNDISINNDGYMPINVSHIYDSNIGKGYDYFAAGQGYQVGYNFKLNIQQRLLHEGSNWIYIDANGGKNYFTDDSVPENKMLGLKLYDTGTSASCKTFLIDKKGNSLVFDNEGFLSQMHQYPSRCGAPINSMMLQLGYYPGSCRLAYITNNNTTVRFNYNHVAGNEYLLANMTYEKTGNVGSAKTMVQYEYDPWLNYRLYNIKKCLNESSNDKHLTRLDYSGSQSEILSHIRNLNGNSSSGNPIDKLIYSYDNVNSSSRKVTQVLNYDNGVLQADKTVNIDYKTESGYQYITAPTNSYTRITNTTVLSLQSGKYVRHVSFDGSQKIADYFYEKNGNSFIPIDTNCNGFDYLSFKDTYADTRTVGLSPSGFINGLVQSLYRYECNSLNHSGINAYAINVWVYQAGPTSWPYIYVIPNGDTSKQELYMTNGQVSGWQFVTVLLNYENLNSLEVKIEGYNGSPISIGHVSVEMPYTDPNNNDLKAEYNSRGDLVREWQYSPLDGKYELTQYEYNSPVGNNSEYPAQISSITKYKDSSTTKAEFLTNLAQKQQSKVTYTYSSNKLTEVKTYGSNSTYLSEKCTYDNNGRISSRTDSNGVVTNYNYDTYGAVTTTIVSNNVNSPSVSTTNRFQNGTGLLDSTTTGGLTTSFGYNSFGQLNQITHNGFNTNLAYNANKELQSISVPNNTLVSYTYSQSQDTTTYGNGQSVKYNYNTDGSIASITNSNNSQATFTYNNGKVSGITNEDGGSYSFQTPQNSHISNIHTIRNTAKGTQYNVDIQSAYADALGNRHDTMYYINGGLQDHYSSYRNGDNLPSVVYRNDGRIDYTYDANQQVSRKNTYFSSAAKNYTYDYTYKSNGSAKTKLLETTAFHINGNTQNEFKYTYYPNGNIEKVISGDVTIYWYFYDEYNRLSWYLDQPAGRNYVYIYDNGGNILKRAEYDLDSKYLCEQKYTYDSQWKDLLIGYNGRQITYDGAGNPWTYKDGSGMTWQNGRELARYSKLGVAANYHYDYAGVRTQKTVNGVTTTYWVDGDRILMEKPSNLNYGMWYYYDESGVYAFQYEGTNYIFQKNIFGDVTRIYNMHTGAFVGEYVYDAWGKIIYQTNNTITNANPFRYRSYYYDTESGFYYLNSRYYDPETGRFINADDPTMLLSNAGIVGGANLFAYCLNNPIKFVDPSGEVWYDPRTWNWKKAGEVAGNLLTDGMNWIDDNIVSPIKNTVNSVSINNVLSISFGSMFSIGESDVPFNMNHGKTWNDFKTWQKISGLVFAGIAIIGGVVAVVGVGMFATPLAPFAPVVTAAGVATFLVAAFVTCLIFGIEWDGTKLLVKGRI
jgi:RHS repeat-associated protein